MGDDTDIAGLVTQLRYRDGEVALALKIADIVLDRPYCDPDDDSAVLARHLTRAFEKLDQAVAVLERLQAERDGLRAALGTINRVVDWQTNRLSFEPELGEGAMARSELPVFPMQVHPLTCGNDSRHTILFPYFDGKKVVLRCADCDYEQQNAGPMTPPPSPGVQHD